MSKFLKNLGTILRYIIGFGFIGSAIINFPSIFSVIAFILGFSFFPFFYKVLTKFAFLSKNKMLGKRLQVFLPLVLFLVSVPFSPTMSPFENKPSQKLTEIEIVNAPSQINVGDQVTLILTTNIENYDFTQLSWEISNPSVVSIQNRVLKGLQDGTARISVKSDSGISFSFNVVVIKEIKIVELKYTEIKIEVGSAFEPQNHLLSTKDGVIITSNVNTNALGTYSVVYKTVDDEKTLTVQVKDTTKPVIDTSHFYSLKGKVFTPTDFVVTAYDFSRISYRFAKTPDFNKIGSNQTVDIIATDESNNSITIVGHYSVLNNVDDYYSSFYLSRSPSVLSFYPTFKDAVSKYTNTNETEFIKVMQTYQLHVNRLGDVPYVTKYKTVDLLLDKAIEQYLWGIDRVYQGLKNGSTIWISEGYSAIDKGIDYLWDCADEIERIKPN